MDKTAEDFRETHKQRQQLISLWENTIDLMIKRDKEMDEAANVMITLSLIAVSVALLVMYIFF